MYSMIRKFFCCLQIVNFFAQKELIVKWKFLSQYFFQIINFFISLKIFLLLKNVHKLICVFNLILKQINKILEYFKGKWFVDLGRSLSILEIELTLAYLESPYTLWLCSLVWSKQQWSQVTAAIRTANLGCRCRPSIYPCLRSSCRMNFFY